MSQNCEKTCLTTERADSGIISAEHLNLSDDNGDCGGIAAIQEKEDDMQHRILDPLEFYKTEGRETHLRHAQECFDHRLERSGVDLAASRAVAQEYEAQEARCTALKNQQLLSILGGIALACCITLGIVCLVLWESSAFHIPVGITLILLGSCLIFGKLYPDYKTNNFQLQEAMEEAGQHYQRAVELLTPLNPMFTPCDGIKLVEQTVPGLSFLQHFTKKHRALMQHFGFREHSDEDSSIFRILAGTFNRSPFLFTTRLSSSMVDHTYEGSKTIHWEEEERRQIQKTRTVTDSDGSERTETYYEWETVIVERSQTLTAEHTAPKPVYTTLTILEYGHPAAPELSFSRKGGHAHKLSESHLQSKVKSGARKLQKKSEHALSGEQDFTAMANEKFDVLFGAADRNNAQQFRNLFSPLAQQNMVALLTDPSLCGDEFSFRKNGQHNTIVCPDSVLNPSPVKYHAYSVDQARANFLTYQSEYFRSLFGCFAPLLAIPAYQDSPPPAPAPAEEGDGCFPLYEREAIANAFAPELLKPAGCGTKMILKTEFVSAEDEAEIIRVHAHSFAARERTTTYRMRGGDGYYHNVNVDWTEYIPKTKTVTIQITADNQSSEEDESTGSVHIHGLTAKIIEPLQEESK